MDVDKVLAELKLEREQIEEAILTLERLARGRGKRRGRPPSWLKDATAAVNGLSEEEESTAGNTEHRRRGRPPGPSKLKTQAVPAEA